MNDHTLISSGFGPPDQQRHAVAGGGGHAAGILYSKLDDYGSNRRVVAAIGKCPRVHLGRNAPPLLIGVTGNLASVLGDRDTPASDTGIRMELRLQSNNRRIE